MMAVWSAVVAVCIWSLGEHVRPVDSSHFMGGVIHWRPVDPAAFDGRVQITHRVTLRQSHSTRPCSRATFNRANFSEGRLVCQKGCNGIIGASTFTCTDYGVVDHIIWSTGEQAYTYNFSATEPCFEASFTTGFNYWILSLIIGGEGRYELRVRGNLTYREDTGLINSSPVANIPSVVYLQLGCRSTITIPVYDTDGDDIRCRWAKTNECAGICRRFPANINERGCELQYEGIVNQVGRYAVALQVEDFASPTDTIPMSSIPVQFIVQIFSSSQSCSSNHQPELIGSTPKDGSCIGAPFFSPWSDVITVRIPYNSSAASITELITASPLGLIRSAPVRNGNLREWQITVTWTPSLSQSGPNVFCFAARDNTKKLSAQHCITLLGGAATSFIAEPPMIIPDSVSPRGNIFHNHTLWSIQFNKQFTRPSKDRFIRMFNEERELLSINVATSSAVYYPKDILEHTLKFEINYHFTEDLTVYILLDKGVAVSGNENCSTESPPLRDPTLWTFTTINDTTAVQNFVCNDHKDTLKELEKRGNIIAVVSTVLAFAFGVICGPLTYQCFWTIIKRKAEQKKTSDKGVHHDKRLHTCIGEEASAIYDEVTHQSCEPGISNVHHPVELNENIAYEQM